MKYTLKGRLHSAICDGHELAISNTKVRLYSLQREVNEVAAFTAAQSKEIIQVFEENEIKARKKELLAETTTDEEGNYEFNFDSKKTNYSGGVIAITLFYDNIPEYGQKGTKLPKRFKPFEILMDVIQPKWRETNSGLVAGWNYGILKRVWCYILSRLDIWVICGTLSNCESQAPLKGIEVIAMDDDIITDDLLGSAVTNDAGQFCIYYRSIDFKKTFLSPWINVETTPVFNFDNGPDIYFKFAVGGSEFFAESPSEAQKPSRKNVGNCLCVNLCLKTTPQGSTDDPITGFYQIGHARKYHPVLSIDPANGKTTGMPNASFNNQAFYNTLDLRGSLTKKLNGQPLEYKFEYAKVSSPSIDISTIPSAAWKPVTEAHMAKNEIATKTIQIFPVWKYRSFAIKGNDTPTFFGDERKVNVTADHWIQVPQDANISFNDSLIKLVSNTLTNGSVDKTGLVQGTSSAPLQKNEYFALRMWKREIGNIASETPAGFSRPLAIFNTKYDGIPQGGSWLPTISNGELGIACLDLKELIGGGCNKITDTINVKYTAANPNLGNVAITFTGQGATNNFEAIIFPSPGEEAFGTSKYLGNFGDLKPCAYEIRLSAELNLTDGEDQHQGIWDRVLFCR